MNRTRWPGVGLALALACTRTERPNTIVRSSSAVQPSASEPQPASSVAPASGIGASPPSTVAQTSAAPITDPCLDARPIPAEPVTSLDSASCVLRVARGLVRNVRVALGDGSERRVHFVDTAVDIAPSERTKGVAAVRSTGAVQVIGTALIDALALRSPSEVAAGMVLAGGQAQLVEFRAQGSEIVGAALLGMTRVEPARVACSRLTTLRDVPPLTEPIPIVGTQRWGVEDDAWLRESSASSAAAVRVQRAPEMSKLEGRAGWLKLSVRYEDGSWIRGWAEERSVRLIPKNVGTGGIGQGIAFGSCSRDLCAAPPPPYAQRGTAHVAAGTTVLDGPHGQPWATLKQAITVRAATTNDSAWIQLQELPGIREHADCELLQHAYVPAASVRFRAAATAHP